MSSAYVRTQIATFIGTNLATENVIDLTNQYDEIQDILASHAPPLTYTDSWLGIQYIGSSEVAINVGADNTQGCYRELGAVFLHVVAPTTPTNAADVLARTEVIRNAFRGQRINDIIIESVTPPNFEAGATLQFDAGFSSASIVINFYRDLNI